MLILLMLCRAFVVDKNIKNHTEADFNLDILRRGKVSDPISKIHWLTSLTDEDLENVESGKNDMLDWEMLITLRE